MTDQYLWDKTGPIDPEVEQLEQVLSAVGEPRPFAEFPFPKPVPRFANKLPLIIASCVAVAAVAIVLVWFHSRPRWECVPLAGRPQVGDRVFAERTVVKVGELLRTDGQSKARLTYGNLAILEIEPNTSVRVTQSQKSGYRLSLEHGKLKAIILAPPNLFSVDTPSAVAIDLGCTYSVELDDEESSIVRVTHGLVSLQAHGRSSLLPGGAVCVVRKNSAPDTPYFPDANPAFLKALYDFDRNPEPRALGAILATARKKDSLSLWHLIVKTNGAEREQVVDQLAEFVPPPANIARDELLRAKRLSLNQWWKAIQEQLIRR